MTVCCHLFFLFPLTLIVTIVIYDLLFSSSKKSSHILKTIKLKFDLVSDEFPCDKGKIKYCIRTCFFFFGKVRTCLEV